MTVWPTDMGHKIKDGLSHRQKWEVPDSGKNKKPRNTIKLVGNILQAFGGLGCKWVSKPGIFISLGITENFKTKSRF